MQHVFKTKLHRAQLRVFDFTGEDAKYAGPHAGKVYFSCSVLPASAHRSTAFSAGQTLYHGEELNTALAYIGNMIGVRSNELRKQLPKRFHKYLEAERD